MHISLQSLLTLGFMTVWGIRFDASQLLMPEHIIPALFGSTIIVLHAHWVAWFFVALIFWQLTWKEDTWANEFGVATWALLIPLGLPLTCFAVLSEI